MKIRDIIEHAVDMYRTYDVGIPIILKKVEDNGYGRPSCDNCTTPYCCNQLVTVWVEEVLLIASVVQGTEYMDKLEAWYKWFKTLPFEDQVWDHKYFKHSRPCPFLTDDKRCGIYEARPTACRGHYVHDAAAPKKCGSFTESPNTLNTTRLGTFSPPVSMQFYVLPLGVYANVTNDPEAGALAERIREEVIKLSKNGEYTRGRAVKRK